MNICSPFATLKTPTLNTGGAFISMVDLFLDPFSQIPKIMDSGPNVTKNMRL